MKPNTPGHLRLQQHLQGEEADYLLDMANWEDNEAL